MSSTTVKINGVTISEGNRKLGDIPSVSFLPQMTCGRHCGVPLLCMADCYAMKMQGYTSVAPSWKQNFEVYSGAPACYWDAIETYLERRNPARFRWHVGGDIPDETHLRGVLRIADRHPRTRFRLFTKAYNLLPPRHPSLKNLRIGISHWPGMENPRIQELEGYTHSWLVPNPKSRAVMAGRLADAKYKIPKRASACPGSCESCTKCWTMRAGSHVKFEQH